MRKYLVLYRAPVSAQEQMAQASPDQAKAGMDAWMTWAKKAGPGVLELGAPLVANAVLGAPTAEIGFIVGYSILQSESLDGATKVLDGHPHLWMPGFSIEVLETMTMPGM